ncbi:MAG: hypothetical protein QOJ03_933 [Frankiaceae bacterium]|nr:hypothetical protein [Frankiaceae bacterium]
MLLGASVAAVSACGPGTVTIALPHPAGAVMASCARLVNYLPAVLDGEHARVVSPRSPLVHAWGSPPVVMRCGVPQPGSFDPASPQTATVNGVTWFQEVGADTVTWTAIRHDADVELIVPTSYEAQGGFLVELSRALKQTIP